MPLEPEVTIPFEEENIEGFTALAKPDPAAQVASQSLWFQRHAGSAPEEIQDFCNKHGIVNEIKGAVRLAQQCFWSSDLALEKDIDPETGGTQIVVAVSIRNRSREEILAAYRAFTEESVKILSGPQSSLIRLSYDLS
jgi:hypothetical protein